MYRIGEFVFDYQQGTLFKNGEQIKIEPQLCELLKLFAERPGELVSRQLITDTLWPQRVITDDAYRAVIKKLRKCLDDNARSPQYIRTVPLKGIILIADTAKLHSHTPLWRSRSVISSTAVALISCVLCAWYLITGQPQNTQLSALTSMNGSEVSPSYNPKIDTLIFSHRANQDDYLQLFSKSLQQEAVMQLTFDAANYANAHFSPAGDSVAYTRSTPQGTSILVASYTSEKGMSEPYTLPETVAGRRYLQAWSASGEGLYLTDFKRAGETQGIWFYDLSSETLTSVTSPGGSGHGDYFARESHSGEWLAVLRDTGDKNSELLVQHLNSGELTHVFTLPDKYHRLVWNQRDDAIMLSNFYGDFASYHLGQGEFEAIDFGTEHVNNAFYSCGERCLFARLHSGNYLDLVVHPNPFHNQPMAGQEYLETDGAEDFPQFGRASGSIYFISQRQQHQQVIAKHGDQRKVLHEFSKSSQFTALQVSGDESFLAGIVDGRLFLINLSSGQFRYLTSGLVRVSTLRWYGTGKELQYARLENGEPVLYRYETTTGNNIRMQEGRVAQLSLSDKQVLSVDSQLTIWKHDNQGSPKILATLPSASPNRWCIVGDELYFTEHEENLAYLNRVNVTTGSHKRILLAKNRYRLNFDILPEGQRLLAVRSVLAQSNLIKVTY